VTLDDAMAMTPSRKLSSVQKVFVGARITHSGQPLAQAGDLEGNAGVVAVNDPSTIKITIDKVH
jgi:cytochrome c-type biogenesis protein CcmH